MGIENFFAFVATALFFIMTPGIDTVFVLNKSIGQGKKAGVYATLGINSGVFIHTVFAALGLSVIVAQSAVAFTLVKYMGAAYLIYLGVAKFLARERADSGVADNQVKESGKKNFISGLVTNTLNPKVAMFFLAFFPQFIQPDYLNNPVPFLMLGGTYAAIGILWFLAVAVFAGTYSKKLIEHPKANQWLSKFSGIVFILMGVKIALAKK